METTTRPLLELWLIVEENFENYFDTGLCNLIYMLGMLGKLEYNERKKLIRIIDDYGHNLIVGSWVYIWPEKEKEPRKQFIQDQILNELRK